MKLIINQVQDETLNNADLVAGTYANACKVNTAKFRPTMVIGDDAAITTRALIGYISSQFPLLIG